MDSYRTELNSECANTSPSNVRIVAQKAIKTALLGHAGFPWIIGGKIKARYAIQLNLTRHKGEEIKSLHPPGLYRPLRLSVPMVINKTPAVLVATTLSNRGGRGGRAIIRYRLCGPIIGFAKLIMFAGARSFDLLCSIWHFCVLCKVTELQKSKFSITGYFYPSDHELVKFLGDRYPLWGLKSPWGSAFIS